MNLKKRTGNTIYFLLIVASATILLTVSQGLALTGKEIVKISYDRDVGDNATAKYKMVLAKNGDSYREREFTLIWAKFGPDGKRMYQISRFFAPADIRGVAFFTKEGEEGSSQFLYLPALKSQARRIVSTQKDRSYVNTDFSYEDMERRSVENSDHRLLGREVITIEGRGNINCYKIESIPKEEPRSQYQKLISWIHPEEFMTLQVDLYKKGQLAKKYRVLSFEKIAGVWTETAVSMTNYKRKHKTYMFLRTGSMKRNQEHIDEEFFTKKIENW